MFFMMPRGQGRRPDVNVSPAMALLVGQVWQRYEQLPVKPPVTFATAGALIAIHAFPGLLLPYSLEAICLSSPLVLAALRHGYVEVALQRLFYSALTHADDMHLYFNCTSLLVKGVLLEQRLGSDVFLGFVLYAVAASAVIFVIAGAVFADLVDGSCAVGFSAALFAMKVLLDHHDQGDANVWGVRVAARHAAWVEVLLASYVNPRASLLGHLSGVLAGLLWLRLSPVFAAARRRRSSSRPRPAAEFHSGRPRYTYASGSVGFDPPSRRPPPHSSRRGPASSSSSSSSSVHSSAGLRRRRTDRLDL